MFKRFTREEPIKDKHLQEFSIAILTGDRQRFDKLMKNFPDIAKVRNPIGPDWISAAVMSADFDEGVFEALKNAGADLNADNKEMGRPINAAIRHGNVKALKALVEAGADVNVRGEHGPTPLFDCLHAHFDGDAMIRILLERGTDPLAKNDHGDTVIDYAKRRDSLVKQFGAEQEFAPILTDWVAAQDARRLVNAAQGAAPGPV